MKKENVIIRDCGIVKIAPSQPATWGTPLGGKCYGLNCLMVKRGLKLPQTGALVTKLLDNGNWVCVCLCVFFCLFVFFFHLLVFQSLFKFTSLNKIATTAFKELKSAHVFNKLIIHRAEVQSY